MSERTGRHCDCPCSNRTSAADVRRGITDDPHGTWINIDLLVFCHGKHCGTSNIVPVMMVVTESAKGKVVIESVVPQFELGPLSKVAGEEP